MHQAISSGCRQAKKATVYILGRDILRKDADILRICQDYYKPQAADQSPEARTTEKKPSSSDRRMGSSESQLTVLFLLEVISSVASLPPLVHDISHKDVITIVGAATKTLPDEQVQLMGGGITFGPGTPETVILAMGKYCAVHAEMERICPTVSSVVLDAWEKTKEFLALNNFFAKTHGTQWDRKEGWLDERGEPSTEDLRLRFGVGMENGRVKKINLAANNLRGTQEAALTAHQ